MTDDHLSPYLDSLSGLDLSRPKPVEEPPAHLTMLLGVAVIAGGIWGMLALTMLERL